MGYGHGSQFFLRRRSVNQNIREDLKRLFIAEPEPVFLDHVPGQTVSAGLGWRQDAGLECDLISRPHRLGKHGAETFEDEDQLLFGVEPVIGEVKRRLIVGTPRHQAGVGDGDRNLLEFAWRKLQWLRNLEFSTIPALGTPGGQPQPEHRVAGDQKRCQARHPSSQGDKGIESPVSSQPDPIESQHQQELKGERHQPRPGLGEQYSLGRDDETEKNEGWTARSGFGRVRKGADPNPGQR